MPSEGGQDPFVVPHPHPLMGLGRARERGPLTGEVSLVPLFEDIPGDLLAVGPLVDVAIEAPQGVVLDDAAHQLAWLTWGRGGGARFARVASSTDPPAPKRTLHGDLPSGHTISHRNSISLFPPCHPPQGREVLLAGLPHRGTP